MQSETRRSIASQGLNEHEQGLLAVQLKMLNSRTKTLWIYEGEGAEADITFVLAQANDTSVSVHLGKALRNTEKRLEWPPRLFIVMSLLGEVEGLLANITTPAPTICSRLADLRTPTVVIHNDLIMVISPNEGRIHSNLATLEKIIDALHAQQNLVEFHPVVSNILPTYTFDLKALLWSLSLQEPSSAASRNWLQVGMEYKLSAWPVFGEWQSSPILMRLSALFSRQFSTVAQGIEFAHTTPVEIAAFLHACERCGLGVQSRAASQVIEMSNSAEQSHGLLQRLRNRLGLGYKGT